MTDSRGHATDTWAKVMLTVWDLTAQDSSSVATPEVIAAQLHKSVGYIRGVLSVIKKDPSRLAEIPYHDPEKPKGRKRVGYRIHENAITLAETALILREFMTFHRQRNNLVDKSAFTAHVSKKFGFNKDDITSRLEDAVHFGYLTNEFKRYLKSTPKLTSDTPYITGLAEKWTESEPSANVAHASAGTASVSRRVATTREAHSKRKGTKP
jgi:hypothetical protein